MADENINDILSKSQNPNITPENKPNIRDVEADQKGKSSNYINQNVYCQVVFESQMNVSVGVFFIF